MRGTGIGEEIGRIGNATNTVGDQENDRQNAGGANQSINRLLRNGPKVRVMLVLIRHVYREYWGYQEIIGCFSHLD